MTATGTLAGRVALVTGGGSGLGQACAVALAAEGARVVVTELPDRLANADPTLAAIRAAGSDGLAVPLDVRNLGQITEAVDAAAAWGGQIDILVNNAGLNIRRDAFEVTEADWDGVLDVNLKGVFFVAQAVGRKMRDQQPQGGAIVNMASIMGLVGYYQRAAYCSSKAGVVNMTRVLAIEWAPIGIRVNAVCPAFVDTPMTKPMFEGNPAFLADVTRRTVVGRLGVPEEIAAAVVFLASPSASFITGQALAADGGWTAI